MLSHLVEDISKLLKKAVSNRAKPDELFTQTNPATVAGGSARLMITLFGDATSVIVPGGYSIPVSNMSCAAVLVLKLCYICNWNYEPGVKSFFGIVEGLAELPITVHIGVQASQILEVFK